MDAHQLREDLDHAPRPDAAGHVDRETLARELVDDGQAFYVRPSAQVSNTTSYAQT